MNKPTDQDPDIDSAPSGEEIPPAEQAAPAQIGEGFDDSEFEGPLLSENGKRALAIAALAILACLPALRAGYLWEDTAVTSHPHIRDAGGIARLWLAPFEGEATDRYRPLLHTTFWLEDRLFGLKPFGSHLINVLLHALNAVLVWRVLRRAGLPGAWLAGALFAVHPTHVAPVACVIERGTLLPAIFCLAALEMYIGFLERRALALYLGAMACLGAAALSDPGAAAFVAVIPLLHWARRDVFDSKRWTDMAPFFVLGAALGGVSLAAAGAGLAEPPEQAIGAFARFLVSTRALFFYVSKTLWPADPMAIYPAWKFGPPAALSYYYPILALAGFAGLWALGRRWGRAPLALGLFYLAALAPGIVYAARHPMAPDFLADHRLYLALAAPLALAAAGAALAEARLGALGRRAQRAALGAAIAAMAAVSLAQGPRFRNEGALWLSNTELNPRSSRVLCNLGIALKTQGSVEEAVSVLTRAVNLDPAAERNHLALGGVLAGMRRFLEAEQQFKDALTINPKSEQALGTYGAMLAAQGRHAEAVGLFRRAIEASPGAAGLRLSLARALTESGDVEGAIKELESFLSTDATNAAAHYEMGRAREAKGERQAALDSYVRAVELRPTYVEAFCSLGTLVAQAGKPEEGIGILRRALELEPDNAEAHNSLGAVLAAIGNTQEAVEHFQKAILALPGYAEALVNLGIELGAQGDCEKAIEAFKSALQNDPSSAEAHNGWGICMARQGNLEEAAKHFEQAVRLKPDYAEAQANFQRARAAITGPPAAAAPPAPTPQP